MTAGELMKYLEKTSEFPLKTMRLSEKNLTIFDIREGFPASRKAIRNRVYVISDKSLEPYGKGSFYAATFPEGPVETMDDAVNLTSMDAPDEKTAWEMVNQGFHALQEIDGTLLSLYQEMAGNRGLQPLLDRASLFLGNPLFLLDQTFHVLSQTPHPFTLKNPILEKEMSPGHLLPESIRQIRQTKILDEILESRSPYVWQVPQGLTFAACPVRYGHVVLAYMILLDRKKAFSERDMFFLKAFEKLMACELMKDSTLFSANRGYRYAEVLENLVNDRERREDIPGYLGSLGYQVKQWTTLFLIAPGPGSKEDSYAFHQVGEQLLRFLGHGMYLIKNHRILYMYDADNPLTEDQENGISELLSSSHLYGSTSSRREGIFFLPRQKKEASLALHLGRKLEPGKNLYHYTDYQAFHAVSLAAPAISRDTLAHGLVSKVMDYDRKNHTALLLTLGTWLMEGGNLHRTAARLYIHENTLRYRLKKINDMGDGKDPKGSTIFETLLCLYDMYLHDETRPLVKEIFMEQ